MQNPKNIPLWQIEYLADIDAMEILIFSNMGAKEFSKVLPQLTSHPDFRRNINQLLDASNIRVDTNSNELRRVARQWMEARQELGSGYKLAVVVQRQADFGLVRMYQAYTDDSHTELNIFYERDLAIKWLSQSKSSIDGELE